MERFAWIGDAAVVGAFVVIGRADHGFESELADYVRVAAPFLGGLAAATVTLRQRPQLQPATGLAVALGTAAVGMVLRRVVWQDGTAFAFIVVTSGFLVAGMAGWRLVARTLMRRTQSA